MQHADFHPSALRAQHGRCGQNPGSSGRAERRGLQKFAAGDAQQPTKHGVLLLISWSLTLVVMLFYTILGVGLDPWSSSMTEPQTIIDKLWNAHEILRRDDGESLLWVDRHYVHEGSFHAFSKLAERRGTVAEPGLTFGVADHYVPTRGSRRNIANAELARMVRQLE